MLYSAHTRRGPNYRHLCEKPFPTSSHPKVPALGSISIRLPTGYLSGLPASLCSACPGLLLDFMHVVCTCILQPALLPAEPQANFPGELLLIHLPSFRFQFFCRPSQSIFPLQLISVIHCSDNLRYIFYRRFLMPLLQENSIQWSAWLEH